MPTPISTTHAIQAAHNGFDADKVWTVFAGPASTSKASGAFARASWHASAAGVADSAAISERKKREPESKNLRSWLRTYRELRKLKEERRQEFMSLLGDYLVTVPGTPTVERWLGEIALQELKHRAHKLSGLSAASGLRLVKIDMRGRRPVGEALDPVSMLTKKEASVASSGKGTVAWPASKFAIQAQAIYREFYGTKSAPGRDLAPLTPAEQCKKRLMGSKPTLGRVVSESKKSIEALRKKHSDSLKAGVEAVRAGAREGPLGELPMLASDGGGGANSKSGKTQMLEAIQEATSLRLKGAPEAEASSEMPPSKKSKLNPIDQQAQILDAKRQALVRAAPGTLPEYVGPRGEGWQDGDEKKCSKKLGAAPAGACWTGSSNKPNPVVYWGPGASDLSEPLRRSYLERLGATEGKRLTHADIVVVDSVAGRWESSEALGARLWGRCLADLEWVKSSKKAGTVLEFRSVFMLSKKLYLSDAFRKQWPEHARLLVKASTKAASLMPGTLAASSSKKCKTTRCFTVLLGKKPADDKKGISLLADAERVALPVVSKHAWGLEHCVSALTLSA